MVLFFIIKINVKCRFLFINIELTAYNIYIVTRNFIPELTSVYFLNKSATNLFIDSKRIKKKNQDDFLIYRSLDKKIF